VDCVRFA